MYYITWQFSCFNTEIRVFDYFYIIIFLKLIQIITDITNEITIDTAIEAINVIISSPP